MKTYPRPLIFLLTTLFCSVTLGQTSPVAAMSQESARDHQRIVVLDAPRLPYRGVVPGASPARLAQRLRELGLTAETRTIEQIISGGLAKAGVFVSLHGHCYPKNLESHLDKFQEQGGSLVGTGIPFSQPCLPGSPLWRDQQRNADFMQRLGLGRSGGPALTRTGFDVSDTGQRIGLDQFQWSKLGPIETHYLDCQTLPPGATCEPLLSLPNAGGRLQPVSALIHRGSDLAPHAWALNLTLHDEAGLNREPHYLEIVARVVARLCEVRGAIDLDAQPLPPVAANLRRFSAMRALTPIQSTPRPNATSIYPHANGVAEKLVVADTRHWAPEERLLARSIQGLANRETAQIWLHQKRIDPFWLDWMQKRGDVRQIEKVASLTELIERFPPTGAVVYDPHQHHTLNIATMIAGVEDLVIATPALAQRFKLEIKQDLRGRFATNTQAYRWAFDTLWPKMSHQVLACVVPEPKILLHDYLVSQRIFTFWISGWVDGMEPGADPKEEERVLAELLQRMPVNIPILGYPHAGDGFGIQERPGVNLFSQTGKFLIPSDYMPNLSVLSATQPVSTPLRQPPPRQITLEDDKVYVALTMSDGDNLNVYYDWFIDDWRSKQHGKFAIGWTISPSAVDFYPAIIDWYYQHLTDKHHIQCAVSGIGYTYPDHYGSAFTDRERVFREFCSLTNDYMQRLDQRTLWLMGATAPVFTRMAKDIPTLWALLPDYGRLDGMTLKNANTHAGGKPVFHVLVDGPPARLGESLLRTVGDQRPAFAHGFLFNWDWRLGDVAGLRRQLPSDYVFVRPDELTQLFVRWQSQQ